MSLACQLDQNVNLVLPDHLSHLHISKLISSGA